MSDLSNLLEWQQYADRLKAERDEACAELIAERERWQELAGLRFGDGVVGMLAEHMEWRRILTNLHTGLHRCIVDGVAGDYLVCTTARALGLYRAQDGFCSHGRTDSACGSDEASRHPQPCQECKSEQSRARLVDSCRYCGWLGGAHADDCSDIGEGSTVNGESVDELGRWVTCTYCPMPEGQHWRTCPVAHPLPEPHQVPRDVTETHVVWTYPNGTTLKVERTLLDPNDPAFRSTPSRACCTTFEDGVYCTCEDA